MFTHVTYLGRHITSMLEGTGKKDSFLLISRIGGGIWIPKELMAFTEQRGLYLKRILQGTSTHTCMDLNKTISSLVFLYYITFLVGMLVKSTSSS